MNILIIVFIVAVCGGFIQRVCGFGFGIFVMLFFPYLISPHTAAAAASTLISCCMSGYNTITYRKYIPYKKIIPLSVGAVVMIPIAVRYSVMISGDFAKMLLGVVLMFLSVYFLFFNQKFKIRPTFFNGVVAGGVGGILTGLFSTGGPPIVLYLLSSTFDKAVYFASTQFYFFVTGIYSTGVRFFNGIITKEVLFYTLVGFFGCIIGNTIGKFTFDKLNSQRLRQIVYAGMFVSGLIMVI